MLLQETHSKLTKKRCSPNSLCFRAFVASFPRDFGLKVWVAIELDSIQFWLISLLAPNARIRRNFAEQNSKKFASFLFFCCWLFTIECFFFPLSSFFLYPTQQQQQQKAILLCFKSIVKCNAKRKIFPRRIFIASNADCFYRPALRETFAFFLLLRPLFALLSLQGEIRKVPSFWMK